MIKDLLEKIEIHYLGNSDPNLFFALLTDFADSSFESAPEDEVHLKIALNGIAELNQKYADKSKEIFFLFHRRRKWNASESAWIGWERKRGKIHEFNRLLRGNQKTSFSVITAPPLLLPTIRFVITLDADTQLPRDSARKLVGTIMHPLNQPYFDKALGRVTDGYGILQPRIGISLESSTRSFFSKIFSGYVGIDPYTTAVSEVYQDLFHEGSYTGKGLYDVDTFESAMTDRIQENSILSHDLLEGLYSRTGLLTDIELLDDYPQSYRVFYTRQHRWVRGDWQIASWILPFVRNAKNKWIQNRIPLISKWKIFDNLRRSLVAPTTFLLFILAWAVLPGSPLFWTSYALLVVIFPSLVQTTLGAIILRFGNHSFRMAATAMKTKINLMQALFYIIFLAHQACIQSDAIIRVFFRKFISKKKLLEWTTAAQTENQKTNSRLPFWQTCWPTESLLLGLACSFLFIIQPAELFLALSFILLWMCYPLVSTMTSQKLINKEKFLNSEDQLLMRQIARRTWNYFETFVGPEHNWLPPDNHQEIPEAVTANRTSPTNMGLYFLSLTAARDFGYVSTSKFVSLIRSSLASMEKLEQFQGHYLNWYDTKTLHPLHPKYVSTVDSGNLAGYLVAARQACLEIRNCFIIDVKIIEGLKDTLYIINSEIRKMGLNSSGLQTQFLNCQNLLTAPMLDSFSNWNFILKTILHSLEVAKQDILILKDKTEIDFSDILKWTEACILVISEAQNDLAIVAPWLADSISEISLPQSHKWKELLQTFDKNTSLESLSRFYDKAIKQVQEFTKEVYESSFLPEDLLKFVESLKKAKAYVHNLLSEAENSAYFMEQNFKAMNFDFLLDKDREVFSIGYSVSSEKFDRGLYDLLGSESRLASFIAIAKGDVSQKHWFRLGRQLVPVSGGRALISWTASMFEYLMPMLVLRDYENTLLSETVHSIVAQQIKYAKKLRVPWGISEAGYNARDLRMNYQYGPFGIPGLGLKRGLSHDLVVSPYSTFLAAMVSPTLAIKNINRLIREGLLTNYGFYESIDYTQERLHENQKFAVIKSFMAHHQGMSLVAINNVINNNITQHRFHNDPRVQATRLLLQERIPQGVEPRPPKAAEVELETQLEPTSNFLVRHYTNPNTTAPHIQLLSNQNYSLMISTAGAGYSKCNELAVTRWKEDATRDNWGSYIFIKDHQTKHVWSTTYQPFDYLPQSYKVTFSEDKVEFRRRDGDISSYTQIIVAPEDNVEIRHVTLTNHSDKPRILELTSYLEPVLGAAANDLDHQAFSKLFIHTEFLASKTALLAKRRKRSSNDNESWGLHVVVTNGEILSDIQYETDRAQFIGRGRTLSNSFVLSGEESLSNTTGAVLDPVFSLRIKIKLAPNAKTQVAFTTGWTASREEALVLADRYHDIHSFERESKLAWTKSKADMRHLNVDAEAAYIYQHLAERILYSEPSLRPPAHLRAANTNIQSSLWPNGISGDLPIVVVRIGDLRGIGIIRKLLRCHEYLRLKGLVYDFIILNEDETTYFQGLQDEIQQIIRISGCQGLLNKSGGVFVFRKDITSKKDIANIQAIARVSLSADEPLKEQINRKVIEKKYPSFLSFTAKKNIEKVPADSALELDFFNGFGGFSKNGREYVIVLRAGQSTPAPWINVIGNKRGFGFQVSETGSGFTWSINSQTNRLTPWSNDPVSDPPGEIIYIRDEETGEVWTPTPLPIRSKATYIIKHSQGFTSFEHFACGIQHNLTLFVPKDDDIKISLLKLKNLTNRKRKITITSYTEWVLGSRREKTAPYLVCDIDQKSSSIIARNPHDNEFASRVAFADISCVDRTFTCSRKEFLGRNGNYTNPAALKRNGLSQKRGTDQDPCAVLQTKIELAKGEEFEMSFILGQSENIESARELSLRYKDLKTVKEALDNVVNYWNNLNNVIQINTPEPAMNILMNNWLLYQTLSCRYWSRTAFYQSGGAYGFRDQLQDCMAFVYSAPELTREHILRAAERQFIEGDVQHWWHPPTGRGIRTRMSDDLLWLPFVVSFYVQATGDESILTEKASFLEAHLLKPDEEDSYTLPNRSTESATIFEHCLRAINHSLTLGQHGLPLIGTGDWNDGMNRVGSQGKGESIWLGWFLYKVLADFLPLCDQPEHSATREIYKSHMKKLKESLEKNGWDGEWYKRAFFDDGSPLGSRINEECRIDSISQSWAVLSTAGDKNRTEQAMKKVSELLIQKNTELVLLLAPPFDKNPKDPGYIKGYVPGVRENGGQYTHAAIWVMMAYAEQGNGDKALELFNMLNPILHSQDKLKADRYKIEPYVIAGDVYSKSPHEGRGGWSWYTGSSSWYYRAGLESLLGFRLQGNKLKIKPCIPSSWKGYEISYTFGSTKYLIKVNNPQGLNTGTTVIEMDSTLLQSSEIELVDDGKNHKIVITLQTQHQSVLDSSTHDL